MRGYEHAERGDDTADLEAAADDAVGLLPDGLVSFCVRDDNV